jgi:hypothetical protein
MNELITMLKPEPGDLLDLGLRIFTIVALIAWGLYLA